MDSDEPINPVVGEPAGQQLKKAREKHGLSQKDVADAQHLRVSIIQSIEDGKYEDIASELFLKGYVRAYAQQVGADPDALIESLDVELEPLREEREKLERENPLIDIERRRRRKRQVAKTLLWLVILGGAAFVAWTYFIEPRFAAQGGTAEVAAAEDQAEASIETADEGPTDNAVSVPDAGDEPATVSEPGPDNPPEAAGEPSSDTLEQAGSALASAESVETVGSSAAPEPEPAPVIEELVTPEEGQEVVSQTELSEVETVNVEPAVQPDPVFEESAQPEAVTEPARLQMSFVADCWVQVTDSSGARLVASLQRAGEQVNVSGRAPFNVIIGAVDAVGTVSFSGEAINLSDYRVVNNRTEFTLSL